jgi:hypothetical protein
MAGGVVVPDGVSAVDYGGGLTLSVFMTCLVAASGGLIFGYDIGISGTVHLTLLSIFFCAEGSPRAFSSPVFLYWSGRASWFSSCFFVTNCFGPSSDRLFRTKASLLDVA